MLLPRAWKQAAVGTREVDGQRRVIGVLCKKRCTPLVGPRALDGTTSCPILLDCASRSGGWG